MLRQAIRAAGSDAVHRTGFTGHQWGEDIQVTSAVAVALAVDIRALALVNRQAAFMVGGDAFAGREVDVGKAQRQAVEGRQRGRLGIGPIAELDALGLNVQVATTGPGPAVDHRARLARGTVPDQVRGADGCGIGAVACAVDRRGSQRQLLEP